jgi:hypothetical protein
MTRLAHGFSVLAAVAVAITLAACGSSHSASSPMSTELSYFPSASPFLIRVVTAPRSPAIKNLQKLLSHVRLASLGEAALISRLQQLGISYDNDIRPLFGNPIMAGFATASPAQARSHFLLAWVTKDEATLKRLIGKLKLQKSETFDGADLYNLSSVELAVDGATLLAAGSAAEVKSALDRHATNRGTNVAEFNRATAGLPSDALFDAFGSLSAVLATQNAASARRIPWVAAVRGYGVAMRATSTGLELHYRIDTSGSQLSSSELPLALGSSPPSLAGSMPIQVGLRQPARTIAFALQAEQAASPAKYSADLTKMNAVRRKTGVDFQRDVLGQVGSNAEIESDGHVLMARVDVVNPSAARTTLRKLGTSALDVLGSHRGAKLTLGPGSFETVHRAHAKNVVFGLVGREFVAGTASAAQLKGFATAPSTPATSAQGAAAFRVALGPLIQLALHQTSSDVAKQVLGALGDLTGWLAAAPDQLTGSASLAIK